MQNKEPERGVTALRPAEGDTVAQHSNSLECCGREATWFPEGKPTFLREKARHDG